MAYTDVGGAFGGSRLVGEFLRGCDVSFIASYLFSFDYLVDYADGGMPSNTTRKLGVPKN